jgi:hypothetical protein
MDFNSLVKNILEDFRAPTDTKKRTKLSSGKYGTVNPILNDPHSTKSISGFKGQPGGKMRTLKFKFPKKKPTKK